MDASSSAAPAPAPAPSAAAQQPSSAAASSAPPASGAGSGEAATKPITKAAKKAVKDYFAAKNWPLNKDLPRGAFADDLQKIATEHGLKRSQVTRQLRNYKKERYGLALVKIILKEGELAEKIREGLATTADEFVIDTLKVAIERKSSNADLNNLCSVLGDIPGPAVALVKRFIDGSGGDRDVVCLGLLAGLIDEWIGLVVEFFPQTAAGLPNAELQFVVKKIEKQDAFTAKWMEEYDDRPPVVIPDAGDSLVGKYAQPVVYYVAGWTLHSLAQALTIPREKRPLYHDFAADQCIEKDAAIALGLPTSLVERRKRMAKMYPTQQYFDFIKLVESTYLANLNLEMMMAYVEGNLIHLIKTKILASDVVVDQFAKLCNEDGERDADEMQLLLSYIMDRYANMRGTYFVKYLKATGNGGTESRVDAQATRTRVVSAVARSKSAADAKAEEKAAAQSTNGTDDEAERRLWESAGESVFEKHTQEMADV
ncbi:hypothetical protein ACHAXT_012012 [Thalassiosira profunda]